MAKKRVKPKNQSVISKIDNLSTYAEYDYDTTPCTPQCRESEDYCRCTSIINARVTKVDMVGIIVYCTKGLKPIQAYCLSRLLIHSGLNDPDNWRVDTSPGYYGEEVIGTSFQASQLQKTMSEFLTLTKNQDMVEFALAQEYGYVLPKLKNRRWTIIKIDKNEIMVPHGDHYRNLHRPVIEIYRTKEWQNIHHDLLPCALCSSDKPKEYCLVDGYHRWAAVDGLVLILVAEPQKEIRGKKT